MKMFYPPKGRLLADSSRGPIVFTHVLFWVRKTLETFQFTSGFLQKKNMKMFYPPKGLCKGDTEGGPIVFTYVLFRLGNVYWTFKIPPFRRPFWDPPNVLFDGVGSVRVGSGWTEYEKCPLKIFILWWYIDKVYTYLYISYKIAANILMGFKI